MLHGIFSSLPICTQQQTGMTNGMACPVYHGPMGERVGMDREEGHYQEHFGSFVDSLHDRLADDFMDAECTRPGSGRGSGNEGRIRS